MWTYLRKICEEGRGRGSELSITMTLTVHSSVWRCPLIAHWYENWFMFGFLAYRIQEQRYKYTHTEYKRIVGCTRWLHEKICVYVAISAHQTMKYWN